jgi:MinD-like ATPase involved in chromosome partitioning or flagellar assembly
VRQRIDCLLVASGKGGVGTSVVASLAALTAAERGDRVLLVDASEGGGTLHHLFGVRPTASLWMLIDEHMQPDVLPMAVDSRLSLVAGGTSAAATAPASDNERRSALARLAHLYTEYDTVIVDGGSRLDTIAALSDLADPTMLLVTAADRLSLAANYALVKSVSARRNDAPIAVLSNRHSEALAAESCDFLIGACSHFLGRTIDVAGVLPDDPCLQAAVGAGMTVRDALDGSPAAEAMRGVLSRVLPSTRTFAAPVPTPVVSPSFRRWS